jgi:hypothetical protein
MTLRINLRFDSFDIVSLVDSLLLRTRKVLFYFHQEESIKVLTGDAFECFEQNKVYATARNSDRRICSVEAQLPTTGRSTGLAKGGRSKATTKVGIRGLAERFTAELAKEMFGSQYDH